MIVHGIRALPTDELDRLLHIAQRRTLYATRNAIAAELRRRARMERSEVA